MANSWILSSIQHTGIYREFLAELKNDELFIDGDKIYTDDGRIAIILDLADHNIEKFEFKKLNIESIIFDEEKTEILLHTKINAIKGKIPEYPKERMYPIEIDDRCSDIYLEDYQLTPYDKPTKMSFEECKINKVYFARSKFFCEFDFKKNIFFNPFLVIKRIFLEKITFQENTFQNNFLIDQSTFCKDFSLKVWGGEIKKKANIQKTTFKGEANFFGGKFETLQIKHTKFNKNVYFGNETCHNEEEGWGETIFQTSLLLENCIFKEKGYFEGSWFQKCNIDACSFQNDVFFDYSTFCEINLSKAFFGQRVSFYHTVFKQPPFFVNCVFDKYLTMMGSELGLEGSEFIKKICDTTNNLCLTHNNKAKNNTAKNNKRRTNNDFLKDFRDGFCNIKNALIKNNNLLDASYYHKAELYCRELELEFKSKKSLRDWIDWAQLFFYRNTSDHHTDLAKIFNNVIMLIALFGIFTFGITLCKEDYLHYEKQYFGRAMTSAIDLSIRKESHSLTKTTQCAKETQIPPKEALSILALCLSFVGIFIGFVALKDTKYKLISWCINISSYVIFLGILIYKPSLLLPFVGQLFGEGLKANFPAMQSLSVVYCILMFLMLFSLQKTARKNSIIPS